MNDSSDDSLTASHLLHDTSLSHKLGKKLERNEIVALL